MSGELMAQARALFSIEDVYACQITATCDRDFEPSASQKIEVQTRLSQAGQAQHYKHLSRLGERHFIKYFVDTGLRVLKPDADPNGEISEDQVLAEITATFVAKYSIKNQREPSEDLVKAFLGECGLSHLALLARMLAVSNDQTSIAATHGTDARCSKCWN